MRNLVLLCLALILFGAALTFFVDEPGETVSEAAETVSGAAGTVADAAEGALDSAQEALGLDSEDTDESETSGSAAAGAATNRDPVAASGSNSASAEASRLLVFSKTEGFRHASIKDGKKALLQLGEEHSVRVDTTEDASMFTEGTLKDYDAVIFLSTTGDVLDDQQQDAFMRYIQAGGGYVGVHAAADTEYDWPWYGRLVGGYFDGHPGPDNVREGVLTVVDSTHKATQHLPTTWTREDEWYDYRALFPAARALLTIDEHSYRDSSEVRWDVHPIAWYHDYDGGRAFYTGLGHTEASYTEPEFLGHLWGGIQHVLDSAEGIDYTRASVLPEENRFVQTVFDQNLNEPMELDLLPDGRILFIERRGDLHVHDPKTSTTKTIATLDVHTEHEDGLLGLALDPNYAENHWVYLFNSPPGDEPKQHVSRFVLKDDQLDLESEKVLLEIPVQRDECCHSGGGLEFDHHGNLYISVGDNTNPFASDGFAPIDERDGRKPWDAQRSSANTDDLRGKILRIHPEDDGTYSIPEGNLFAEDGSEGRPEIYVMGNRNPFRTSIDSKTGYLYWGEVGPDARENSTERGPKGHDEVNQARQAGNFGWPLFVGNNKAYHEFDFADSLAGEAFSPQAPVNASMNNTGAKQLPPAQPAFIWYPYDVSPEFPLVGSGGRNAMAGPVYHAADYQDSGRNFPAYYDGKLFIYDWIRSWIMAVEMDENGNFKEMEQVMPSTAFHNPMDMLFGPDGALYLLEYGSGWFSQNLDARLSRIDFVSGNRQPVARIEADSTVGATPLAVRFSAAESMDFDGDDLQYAWSFDGSGTVQSTEKEPTFTFEKPGVYKPTLTVTDPDGETSEASVDVLAGNAVPRLALNLDGNRTFFWDDEKLPYTVTVTDVEDGKLGDGIDSSRVRLSFDYLAEGYDLTSIAQGHEALMMASSATIGKELMAGSDCQACHKVDATSVGPSFTAVAEKYAEEEDAVPYLIEKIIKGGSGVWGEVAMAAHPQLKPEEAEKMVAYILSVGKTEEPDTTGRQPLKGTLALDQHAGQGEEGRYVLTASYTDQGAGDLGALTAREIVALRHPRVQAETSSGTSEGTITYTVPESTPGVEKPFDVLVGPSGGYAYFAGIDLTDVGAITALVGLVPDMTSGGVIEVHLDAPDGPAIGAFDVAMRSNKAGFHEYTARLQPTKGTHDLYFTFVGESGGDAPVAAVDWFRFHHQGEQLP